MAIKPYFPALVVALLATAMLAACQKQPEIRPSGKSIKIAVIAPLSGTDNNRGQTGLQGIRIAQKFMPLLDNGDRIDLVIFDDQGKPELGKAGLVTLVKKTEPVSLILLSNSNTALALGDNIGNHELPTLAAFATNAKITRKSPYITQLGFNDDFQGMVAALFVHDELLLDRVAVFGRTDSIYSSDLAEKFVEKFAAVRGQVTDNIMLDRIPGNFTRLLKAVKKNEPQLLYLPLDSHTISRLLASLKEIDWQPRILVSDSFMRNVFKDNPHDINRLHGLMASSTYSPSDKFSKFGQQVVNLYERQYGKLDIHAMLGIEAYALTVHAINACKQRVDRQCINRQLHHIRGFTGVQNRIFTDRDGQASRPLYINRIDGENIEMLVKVY